MTDKITIRGKKGTSRQVYIGFVFLFIGVLVFWIVNKLLGVPWGAIPFLFFAFSPEYYYRRKPQVEINTNGIMLFDEKEFIEWQNIKSIIFDMYSGSIGNYKNTIEYIHIETVDRTIIKETKELKQYIHSIERFKNDYSKPLKIKDRFKDEVILPLLTKTENCDEIMIQLSKYNKIYSIVAFTYTFCILLIFTIIQALVKFKYIFLIGFILIGILPIVLNKIKKRIKSNQSLIGLTDIEFDNIAGNFLDIYSLKNKNTIFYSIFSTLTIGIFLIIFFLS